MSPDAVDVAVDGRRLKDSGASVVYLSSRTGDKGARGGAYHGHLLFATVLSGLAWSGAVYPALAAWVWLCLVAAFLLDRTRRQRKLAVRSMLPQLSLYAQLVGHAACDALPYYALAFALYVCVAPIWGRAHFGPNSFLLLYGFYMVMRAGWLVRYLWAWGRGSEGALKTFQSPKANLRSRGLAIQHLLWSYFLGNVGLVVRCSTQVVTLAMFETARQSWRLDLSEHAALAGRLEWICGFATLVFLATMWPALNRVRRIYYRTHRTLHSCRPLYDSIHSIHHRAILPTPLDSGTISPLEFAITEMAFPAGALLPNWWWASYQALVGLFGHWPSHDAGTENPQSQHHVDHHRLQVVNFGLLPWDDDLYGTRYRRTGGERPIALARGERERSVSRSGV